MGGCLVAARVLVAVVDGAIRKIWIGSAGDDDR